jgi:hypothetical protein
MTMSTLIHCDGPDCTEMRDPNLPDMRRLGEDGWVHLDEGRDRQDRDFHSVECLSRWAEQNAGGRRRANEQPCTCRLADLRPHTKAEHQPYPQTGTAAGPEARS